MISILPNDEPLIPRLAFPTGQRVLVGPLDYGGMNGVVDWAADTPMPGGRYMPEERMTESYPGTVPVRIQATTAFISTRWLLTLP